jgi:hypothetical protein
VVYNDEEAAVGDAQLVVVVDKVGEHQLATIVS